MVFLDWFFAQLWPGSSYDFLFKKTILKKDFLHFSAYCSEWKVLLLYGLFFFSTRLVEFFCFVVVFLQTLAYIFSSLIWHNINILKTNKFTNVNKKELSYFRSNSDFAWRVLVGANPSFFSFFFFVLMRFTSVGILLLKEKFKRNDSKNRLINFYIYARTFSYFYWVSLQIRESKRGS